MTVFSEDQLERELSDRLHHEMSSIHQPAGLATTVRRRHQRQTWSMRVAAAVPAVAAIAIGATVTLAPSAARVADPPSATQAALDVKYVSSRTTAALGKLTDYYQRAHEVRADGAVVDFRADATTQRERTDTYDAKGTHLISATKKGSGSNNALVVDYVNKTWWTDQFAAPQASGATDSAIIDGPIYDPAVITKAQESGTLQLVGGEIIDGRNTQHLRWSTVPGFTLDLWVDANTYLPVRHTAAGLKARYTVDYTWLPRTEQNLAELDLTPPPGFTRGAPFTKNSK